MEWADFLNDGPQWVQKRDRGAGVQECFGDPPHIYHRIWRKGALMSIENQQKQNSNKVFI